MSFYESQIGKYKNGCGVMDDCVQCIMMNCKDRSGESMYEKL